MLDGAYKSISEANGACIELEEVRDEDFRAEFKETAIQALDKAGQTEAGEKPAKPESLPAAIIPPNAAEDFDTLDEIYAQTGALLTMLFTYIGEVGPHGEELHPHVIQNYIWQIQSNNKRAARLSDEIYRGLKQGGSNHA